MLQAVTPLSWVVFLGNDTKNPQRYVEEPKAIVKNDAWKGTKQSFTVGAFAEKFTGKDEAEQMKNAVASGKMSVLSAPIEIQFLAEDKK